MDGNRCITEGIRINYSNQPDPTSIQAQQNKQWLTALTDSDPATATHKLIFHSFYICEKKKRKAKCDSWMAVSLCKYGRISPQTFYQDNTDKQIFRKYTYYQWIRFFLKLSNIISPTDKIKTNKYIKNLTTYIVISFLIVYCNSHLYNKLQYVNVVQGK